MTLQPTSLDRVLWPSVGFTKGQLIDYYAAVADVLLPHIAERPMTLGRWPGGVEAPGFAQTECRGAPDWVATRRLRLRGGGARDFCLLNDRPSLLWAANLGTIELHPYYGGGTDGEDAMLVIFDLDPRAGAGLLDAAAAALALRALLGQRGLEGFAKASGGHGIHVFVPLNVPHSFEQTRAFCAGRSSNAPWPRIVPTCSHLPLRTCRPASNSSAICSVRCSAASSDCRSPVRVPATD